MAMERLVAQRVDDDYEIVPAGGGGLGERALPLAGGALLVLRGLMRGGPLAPLWLLGGSGLVYYGLTGNDPFTALASLLPGQDDRGPQSSPGRRLPSGRSAGPTYQHDALARSTQQPADAVDEAVMESFPASDPPSH